MDFVHDQLGHRPEDLGADYCRYYTRFSLMVDPRPSYKGEDIVATLERICRNIGYPQSIRVGEGSAFISRSSTCRPVKRVSSSTSHGRASRPVTASSSV